MRAARVSLGAVTEPPRLSDEIEFPEGATRYPGRHVVVDGVLRRGGEAIPVVVKKTRKSLAERLFGSRSERALAAAKELIARGLPTPEPIGVDDLGAETWYVCRKVEGAAQVRDWFLERDGRGFPPPRVPVPFPELVAALGLLARRMHEAGVFYRDFSDGNVLVTAERGAPRFWLVDLTRARFFPGPVGDLRRLRDLSRLGLNRTGDRKLLLASYVGSDAAPTWFEASLSALRRRILIWDEWKDRLRPWKWGRRR
jgi:hypothetical protein